MGPFGGLRIGELAGLRHRRVDLDQGTVEVAEIVTEVAGKLQPGAPKTRAAYRRVALPRSVVDELAGHFPSGADPAGWVFTAPGLDRSA
ncbi:MAG TPA: hypothetical protein VFA45_22790 [Actinomycetes bacterium]|nr:hypothetical protein [Actinomycetes bacterium]